MQAVKPHSTAQPARHLDLLDRAVDEPRPIKVVVIGAGFSGIVAAIRLAQRVKNLDLVVYEASDGIGGTWNLNKYPGAACDVPSPAYQYTFESNSNWSAYYVPGREIQEYLQGVAANYNVQQYIKIRHRVLEARFCEASGKWTLSVQRPANSVSVNGTASGLLNGHAAAVEEVEVQADVVVTGLGPLSRWKWPDIEGMRDFQGKLIHSARWETGEGDISKGWEDTVKSWTSKRVAVIGAGSTGLQIVPSLQPKVAKLFNYVRGKTWTGFPVSIPELAKDTQTTTASNYYFTDDDKANLRDGEYYQRFRMKLESEINHSHKLTIHGTDAAEKARLVFSQYMRAKLEKKPWIADHITPTFPVGCRSRTPGPGYLDALCEDNVEFIPTPIARFTPTGIQTSDGEHQKLDVIICATGFDTSFQLPFPIIGKNGVSLNDANKPYPRTYLSVATPGFPNLFQILGPNGNIAAGHLLVVVEKMADYVTDAVLKMQRELIKTMEPTQEAADDFDEYVQAYFPQTVFAHKCRSWYKAGQDEGRIVGLWPGSSLHAVKTLSNPRWEDYSYTYHSSTGTSKHTSRFAFLGNGETFNEREGNGDLAWYHREVDHPPRLLEKQ